MEFVDAEVEIWTESTSRRIPRGLEFDKNGGIVELDGQNI